MWSQSAHFVNQPLYMLIHDITPYSNIAHSDTVTVFSSSMAEAAPSNEGNHTYVGTTRGTFADPTFVPLLRHSLTDGAGYSSANNPSRVACVALLWSSNHHYSLYDICVPGKFRFDIDKFFVADIVAGFRKFINKLRIQSPQVTNQISVWLAIWWSERNCVNRCVYCK